VEPELLLAGEYPSSPEPGRAVQKIRLLVDGGIDSIVDLTTPADGLDSYLESLHAASREAGREIAHHSYPIPDNHVIDQAGYDRILTCIRNETDSGRRVYLHCWGGKGRTSTVVGCLLIDQGLDYDATIARIAELRAGTRKAHDPCPESPSQHELLRKRAAGR
jgi:protein-tyrosine phosphatase